MVTSVSAETGLVATPKLALVAPAGMVMLDGTYTTPALLLERATVTPPEGAAALSVTVPCDEPPAVTLEGLSAREVKDGAEGGGATTVIMTLPDVVAAPSESVATAVKE